MQGPERFVHGRVHSQDSQGLLYEPLDPGDGADIIVDRGACNRRRRCFDTEGRTFNTIAGIVICASIIILGLEADLGLIAVPGATTDPQWVGLETDFSLAGVSHPQQKDVEAMLENGLKFDRGVRNELGFSDMKGHAYPMSGAYTLCEFFFVSFFLAELCLRLCSRCQGCAMDPWLLLDSAVVVQGALDLSLPVVLGANPAPIGLAVLTVLRALRVLRVFRIIRVCRELQVAAEAFMKAFAVLLWVGAIIFILNFVCAILLTAFVGHNAHAWGEHATEINSWFGSIGRSMQTLFTVMTLAGWDQIALTLGEVIPGFAVSVFFVLYIMLCFFTLVSLVTGIVSDSFVSAKLEEKEQERHEFEAHRAMLTNALTNVLCSCDQSKKGYFDREEYISALDLHPAFLQKLNKLGIDTKADELVQVFDRLSQDAEFSGKVKIDNISEAMANLQGIATTTGVYDLKYSLCAMRRETAKHVAEMKTEVVAQHDKVTDKMATMEQMTEMRHEVCTIKQDVDVLRQGLSTMNNKIDQMIAISEKLNNREKFEDSEQHEVLTKMNVRLDELATRLVAMGPPDGKCTEIDGVMHEDNDKSAENAAIPWAEPESTLLAEKWAAELAEAAKPQTMEPDSAFCPELHAELESSKLDLEPEFAVPIELESTQHSESESIAGTEPVPQDKTEQGNNMDSDMFKGWGVDQIFGKVITPRPTDK